MGEDFYREAFARNLGIISEAEQEVLRRSRVAILGLGGVGGIHLATLARLGVGGFRIADGDAFETANINRQYGACAATLGRNKTEVMAELAKQLNPGVEIAAFPEGVSARVLDAFLEGADLVIDGVDFFAVDVRRQVFRRARERGLHVVSAGPVGFGAALLVFSPSGMSFDDYFGLRDDMSWEEMVAAFAVGLAPAGWHVGYMDLSRVDLEGRKAPGLASACALCAGLAATEVLKILLKRGRLLAAPHYLQLDPYLLRWRKGYMAFGGRNPLQQLKRRLLLRKVRSLSRERGLG